MLNECRRVLRPGRRFYLSTKNRYSLRLLAGAYDEHVEFRFGSALLRWATIRILKGRELSKPPGYLHSRLEFEDLLKEAGFKNLQPFLALPDARYPDFIETFDRAGIAKMKKNYSGARKRKMITAFLSLPFFLQKKMAPSHVYVAEGA